MTTKIVIYIAAIKSVLVGAWGSHSLRAKYLALVIGTIARELGLQARSKKSAGDLLKEYLSKRQILLVLDNFEQVVTAAPAVAIYCLPAPD